MVKALESAKSLRILRCDLWSLSLVNVKNVLEHSPRLEASFSLERATAL